MLRPRTLGLLVFVISCVLIPRSAAAQAVGGKVLIVGTDPHVEAVLRSDRYDVERRSILPDDLSGYRGIVLSGWSSLDASAARQLTVYVEGGGGLVTWANVVCPLTRGVPGVLFRQPWMGITSITSLVTKAELELPEKLFDEPIKKRVYTFGGSLLQPLCGVSSHARGGEFLASMICEVDQRTLGAVYTYSPGQGRFVCLGGGPWEAEAAQASLLWVIRCPPRLMLR
jgi:hypothetical protein